MFTPCLSTVYVVSEVTGYIYYKEADTHHTELQEDNQIYPPVKP
jgi:hypothetical protein